LACVFKCGEPDGDDMEPVSIPATSKGDFLASTTDAGFAERVDGKAHPACYVGWYHKTYPEAFSA
jgi:hypothetical protein